MNPLDELRNENDAQQQSLPEKDRDTMRRVSRYIAGWKVNAYDAECIRRDLIGMAQEAAARGQSLAMAIGDEQTFCASVVENAREKSWMERLLFMGSQVCAMLLLFMLAKTFIFETTSTVVPLQIPEILFYTLYSIAAAIFNHYWLGRLALEPVKAKLVPVLLILAAVAFARLLVPRLEAPSMYVNKYAVLGALGIATLAVYLLKEWYVRHKLIPEKL